MAATPSPDLMTEYQFAHQLGLTIWALRDWKRKGFGPPRYKILKLIYYKRAEVAAFLDDHLAPG